MFARSIGSSDPDAPVDYGLAILTHRRRRFVPRGRGLGVPAAHVSHAAGDRGRRGADRVRLCGHGADRDAAAEPGDGSSPDVGLPASPLQRKPLHHGDQGVLRAPWRDDRPVRVTAEDGLAALQIAAGRRRVGAHGTGCAPHAPAGGAAMKIGILSFAHLHAEAYIRNLRAIPGVEFIGLADEDAARGQQATRSNSAHPLPVLRGAAGRAARRRAGLLGKQQAPPAGRDGGGGRACMCSAKSRWRPTLEDAQAMIDACDRAGVKLMTAFPMRFSAPLSRSQGPARRGRAGAGLLLQRHQPGADADAPPRLVRGP